MEDMDNTISPSPANAGTDIPATGRLDIVQTGTTMERNITGEAGGSAGGSGALMAIDMMLRRKRGRPRKYDVNESMVFGNMSPGFSTSASEASPKRGRGRPRGSGKLQLLASLGGFAAETAGTDFIPHVVTIHTGEDIVKKLVSFTQGCPRAVCVLSANGVVSSVILRQPGSSGSTLRYEGRFEILTLTGTFSFGETSSARRKNGMLTVSLAKPDGRVFGGAVVGSLIAAGPIQLVLGSFKQSAKKGVQGRHAAESSMAAGGRPGNLDVARVPLPMARMTNNDENRLIPTSALSEPIHGGADSIITYDQNSNPASLRSVAWNASNPSELMSDQRTFHGINANVPGI